MARQHEGQGEVKSLAHDRVFVAGFACLAVLNVVIAVVVGSPWAWIGVPITVALGLGLQRWRREATRPPNARA